MRPRPRRFWFLVDFKDRLVNMLIDLEETSEKLDRHDRLRFCQSLRPASLVVWLFYTSTRALAVFKCCSACWREVVAVIA